MTAGVLVALTFYFIVVIVRPFEIRNNNALSIHVTKNYIVIGYTCICPTSVLFPIIAIYS